MRAAPIEFDGLTLSVTDWSRRTGIAACTLSWRLDHGWSVEAALTTPVPPRKKREARIYEQNRQCAGCRYGRLLHFRGESPYYCAHILITGKRRPWPVGECIKKEGLFL